jgi:hypothetical protein
MVGEFPSLSVGLVSQRLLRQRRGCDLHGIGGICGAGRAGAGLYAMFSTETRNGVFGNGKRTPPPTPRRPPRCYARQRGRDFHGCKHSLSASKDAKWKQPTRWARGSLENRYQFYKTRDSAKRKHRREKPGVVSRYVGVRSRGCRASRNFLQTRSPPGGTDLLVRADSPGRFGVQNLRGRYKWHFSRVQLYFNRVTDTGGTPKLPPPFSRRRALSPVERPCTFRRRQNRVPDHRGRQHRGPYEWQHRGPCDCLRTGRTQRYDCLRTDDTRG